MLPQASTAPRLRRRRRARPAPQWWRDVSGTAFIAVLGAVTALWAANGGIQELGSVAGFFTSTGRLTGLIASALLLVQVLLMARVPMIEGAWGQDELTRVHRVVGFTSFTLMLVHIALVTVGYALSQHTEIVRTGIDLVLTYPGMLLAAAGTLALIMVVVTSFAKVRSRLRYENWHLLHLYAYLGVGLALPHQLWTGADFLFSPLATTFWWGLWGLAVAAVLAYRVVLPLWRSWRHRLRVVDVRHEGGATSVTVAGRHLRDLPVHAGQFFQWRLLDGPGWTRAHPFSLSAAPDGQTLRFTAAHVGDGSARLAEVAVGAPVLIEGPYGRMHVGERTRRKVLLMGAGIGIAPLRAILEGLDDVAGNVTVIHRTSGPGRTWLVGETAALAERRGARYLDLPGHRATTRHSWLPQEWEHVSDLHALRSLVPDVAEHDVFLCGAPGWMTAVEATLQQTGVPRRHVHAERFTT